MGSSLGIHETVGTLRPFKRHEWPSERMRCHETFVNETAFLVQNALDHFDSGLAQHGYASAGHSRSISSLAHGGVLP